MRLRKRNRKFRRREKKTLPTAKPENAEAEDVGAEDETDGEAEPYHKTLSRKERRKLKRMKKFRR